MSALVPKVAEVAELLRCSTDSVYRMIAESELDLARSAGRSSSRAVQFGAQDPSECGSPVHTARVLGVPLAAQGDQA